MNRKAKSDLHGDKQLRLGPKPKSGSIGEARDIVKYILRCVIKLCFIHGKQMLNMPHLNYSNASLWERKICSIQGELV